VTDADRPTFTLAGAADATGRSRRTIGRLLEAGQLEGAHRDDTGAWVIPLAALLGAGLHLNAPTPPDDPPPAQPAPVADDADLLRAENAELRRRAEVAEAIAAERAQALEDMRASLRIAERMLESGSIDDDTPTPIPAPDTAPAAVTPAPSGRLARLWNRRR
jgi:hypothetical protein